MSFGISSILAIRDLLDVSSTYSILGYLKVWSSFRYLYVFKRSFSLNILLGFISIELIIAVGLTFTKLSVKKLYPSNISLVLSLFLLINTLTSDMVYILKGF